MAIGLKLVDHHSINKYVNKSHPIQNFVKNIGKFFLISLALITFACDAGTSENGKVVHFRNKKEAATNSNTSSNFKTSKQAEHEKVVPQKVYEVLEYIRQNNRAPNGYVGGKRFGNFEKRLPLKDENGKKMTYKEWDVNPRLHGKNRGAERLITSNDDRAWYTSDHYESFIEFH